MKKAVLLSILLAVLGGFASGLVPQDAPAPEQEKSAPEQKQPEKKEPEKKKEEPDPNKRRRRWGPDGCSAVGRVSAVRDGSTHNGETVQADLPVDQLVPNTVGIDNEGLCTFTSIMFGARLQNVPQLKDFQKFMTRYRGGGWPQKVDAMIAACCKAANMPIPDYIQVENGDWSLIELALKTGRMPAITYKVPDKFGRLVLAHMVNIVCLRNGVAAFRDNNFVGEKEIEWWSEAEGKDRAGGSHFWAVILLAPRPPMPPHNGKPASCSAPYVPGSYEWRKFPDCLQWALWRDGEQVGGYDAEQDRYGVFNKGEWTNFYRRPPVDLPADAFPALAGRVPGGVYFQFESEPRYSRNGVVISKQEAINALKLEDDSKRPSLTVIGKQSHLDAVRAAVVASDLASKVCFQAYTPDDWAINTERFGFAHDGEPTIYLQKPDGEVLLHLKGFGVETLAQIRRKMPYDPANDPGIKPEAPIQSEPHPLIPAAVGIAVVVIVLTLLSKDSQ